MHGKGKILIHKISISKGNVQSCIDRMTTRSAHLNIQRKKEKKKKRGLLGFPLRSYVKNILADPAKRRLLHKIAVVKTDERKLLFSTL